MSELSPRIKSGWLRATLFFIVSLITSQIFAGIGLVVVLLATGFDLNALSNQEEITNAVKGVNFLLPLKIIEFLSLFVVDLFSKESNLIAISSIKSAGAVMRKPDLLKTLPQQLQFEILLKIEEHL